MDDKNLWQKMVGWFRGEDGQQHADYSQDEPAYEKSAAVATLDPDIVDDRQDEEDDFDDEMDFEPEMEQPAEPEIEPEPEPEPESERVESETPSPTSILTARRGNKREQQLAAMEESFNRLLEVLESLNKNVENQNRQQAELLTRLNDTSDVMKETVSAQARTMEKLTEEVKNQSSSNEQMADVLKMLPDLSREQVEKLNGITQQLESSAEHSSQLTDTFNKFDSTFQHLMDNTKAQTLSLANMGQMLEENEKQVNDLMAGQSKRFAWLVVGVIFTSLATIGVLVAVLMSITR